ncbi:MAG: hypothetical protein WCJ95_22000, partial [Mariniphaga sp.]
NTQSFNSGCSIRLIRDTLSGWVSGEKMVDYDENEYETVQIGDQVWITSNLITEHFNDGSAITIISDNEQWMAMTSEAMCYYANDVNNAYTINENSGSGTGEFLIHSTDLVRLKDSDTVQWIVNGVSETEVTVEANIVGAKADAQVQVDWEQSDSGAVDYVKNKPIIPEAMNQVQSDWEQMDSGEPDYIKNKPNIPGIDNSFELYIDFTAVKAFVFSCPFAMKFTAQTSEGTSATLSPALNTNLAQFQDVTITPVVTGLIILTGTLL